MHQVKIIGPDSSFTIEEIPDDDWKPSYHHQYTLHDNSLQRKLDPEIRNSFTYANKFPIQVSKDLQEGIELYLFVHVNVSYIQYDKVEIHKYIQGSKFSTHVDRPIHPNHIGNIILAWYSTDSVGGELFVDKKLIFSNQSNRNEWVCTYISLGTEHHVSKLTDGKRYSITIPIFNDIPISTEKVKIHPDLGKTADVSFPLGGRTDVPCYSFLTNTTTN